MKEEKAEFLIERINQYNGSAGTSKEARRYVERCAMTWWRIGDEEMGEWSERKGIICIKWLNTVIGNR